MHRAIIRHKLCITPLVSRTIPMTQKFCTKNDSKSELASCVSNDINAIQKRIESLEENFQKMNARLISNTKLGAPPTKYYYERTEDTVDSSDAVRYTLCLIMGCVSLMLLYCLHKSAVSERPYRTCARNKNSRYKKE